MIDIYIETLRKSLEESEERRKQEASDNKAQVTVLMDKVKRLKALLAKSRDLAVEKDAQIQRLGEGGRGPLKEFSVVCRVRVDVNAASAASEVWCLLTYSSISSKTTKQSPASQVRWVKDSEMQQWLSEGVASVNGLFPEVVQDTFEKREQELLRQCEEEKESLLNEIEDVNQKFQSYKTKANAALKRLGKEDHAERQRHQVEEESKTNALHERIQELERLQSEYFLREKELNAEITSLQEELSTIKATVISLEDTARIHVGNMEDIQAELYRCRESRKNAEELRDKMKEELDALRRSKPRAEKSEESLAAIVSPSVPMESRLQSSESEVRSRPKREDSKIDTAFPAPLIGDMDIPSSGLMVLSQVRSPFHSVVCHII